MRSGSSELVDQMTRYSSRKDLGLGMLKLSNFWHEVRLSCLRHLPYSKSIWARIHKEEVGKHGFCPVNSNMEDLEEAKKLITNLVWYEIYGTLIKCKYNIVNLHPVEFLTIPINQELDMTTNFNGIQQGW